MMLSVLSLKVCHVTFITFVSPNKCFENGHQKLLKQPCSTMRTVHIRVIWQRCSPPSASSSSSFLAADVITAAAAAAAATAAASAKKKDSYMTDKRRTIFFWSQTRQTEFVKNQDERQRFFFLLCRKEIRGKMQKLYFPPHQEEISWEFYFPCLVQQNSDIVYTSKLARVLIALIATHINGLSNPPCGNLVHTNRSSTVLAASISGVGVGGGKGVTPGT